MSNARGSSRINLTTLRAKTGYYGLYEYVWLYQPFMTGPPHINSSTDSFFSIKNWSHFVSEVNRHVVATLVDLQNNDCSSFNWFAAVKRSAEVNAAF